MSVSTPHDVLSRVGPFKLIRGDPGRPDGWIQPDSVVDEEEDVVNLNKKEVESVHKSEDLLLFHLDEDPYEKINLATKFPAITKYLSKLLDKYEVIFLFTNQNCSFIKARMVAPDIAGRLEEGNPSNFGGVWSTGWCNVSNETVP